MKAWKLWMGDRLSWLWSGLLRLFTRHGGALLMALVMAAMLLWAAYGEETPGPPPAGSDVVYRCTTDGQMVLRLTAPQAGTYYARVDAKACILAAFPQT